MLKDTRLNRNGRNSAENETHFSYNDYKQKTGKRSHRDLTVFISVLVIGILIFLGFAKILSPNVDVGIADNDDEEYSQFEEDTSSGIDGRLKGIRKEDDGESSDDDMFSPELDEKVVLPKQTRKTVGEMEAEMQNEELSLDKAESPDKQISKHEEKSAPEQEPEAVKHNEKLPAAAVSSNVKVVVGSYATEKQAEVAKSIMQDAGLGVIPIVKNFGGTYTLQVGSYSSREKASQAVNSLLKSNFPARIVE